MGSRVPPELLHELRRRVSQRLAVLESRRRDWMPAEERRAYIDRLASSEHLERLGTGQEGPDRPARLERLHQAREELRERRSRQSKIAQEAAGAGGRVGGPEEGPESPRAFTADSAPGGFPRAPRGPATSANALAASEASETPAVAVAGASRLLDKLPTPNLSPDGRTWRRSRRSRLRLALQRLSESPRVCQCGRRAELENVAIRRTEAGVAHYTGLRTCGRAWVCPVCAAKVGAERAREVERALTTHLEEHDGAALFLTLTFPHDAGDELAAMLRLVSLAYSSILTGKRWQRWRRDYGIVGTIRSLEVTHGRHGWHPHLHVAILTQGRFSVAERARLRRYCFAVWARVVTAAGFRMPKYKLCPVRVLTDALGVSEYLTKFGATYELTRWDMKRARADGSRTFFDILEDYEATGRDRDAVLVRQWEKATYRARAVTWSRGLKARYFLEEKTDEEIAAEEVGGDEVLAITRELYYDVQAAGAAVALLEAVERGGAPEALELLESLPQWRPGAAVVAVYDTG